jgi:hypothetical protein
MKIQLDTEGLKDTKWYQYALRFVFGGAMTVVAGMVAKEFGPTVGGLLLGRISARVSPQTRRCTGCQWCNDGGAGANDLCACCFQASLW